MTEERREKLLGYLLDALDDDEREAIDCEVAASPALHNELTELVGELQPLSVLKGYYTPADAELVARTCDAVWREQEVGEFADEAVAEPVADAIPEPVAEVPQASPLATRHSPLTPSPSPLATRHSLTLRAQIQPIQPRRTSPLASRPSPLVPPHIRWASRLASISVGTLIAILFFPVFTFVKDKVVARVCQVLMLDVEANMEYYKQIQENSAIVRARESSGSLRTSQSQWRSIVSQSPPIAQATVPTPELLDEIPPLKIALAQDSVASLFSADQNGVDNNAPLSNNDNLRILADPKTVSGQGQRLYPFLGESIFISGDQVYYRMIPTR